MSRNRLILAGLLFSIAFNLIFIGGIATRLSGSRGFSPRPFPPNVSWAVRDLSEERRDDLSPLMAQSFEEIRPLRREMYEAQQQVNQLMAAEIYDPVAMSQAFTELRQVNLRYQELSHRQTVTILDQLTDEERRMSLEFISRRGPRDRRSGFRGGDGSPGMRPGAGPGRPPFPSHRGPGQ